MPFWAGAQSYESETRQLIQTMAELRSDLDALERRNANLEHRNRRQMMISLLLFGVFCAYWAMTTGRNPWLWFFLGTVLSVPAAIEILYLTRRMLKKPLINPITGVSNWTRHPENA